MHQSWDKLLFMHWEIPVSVLRPLIPDLLTIDTFEGKAWIAVTPLTIWDLRPSFIPALPFISELHELNVRTYVHFNGVPGVWFFSLDANNFLAVAGARLFFRLPYYHSIIDLEQTENNVTFNSERAESDAKFEASWTVGNASRPAEPGTLEFFLLERYCLYTCDEKYVYRCRIHHQPWPLQKTQQLWKYRSTMIEAAGMPEPTSDPLLHCGGPVHVEVWPLENLGVLKAE
jgi:uncharacterized protein YqjF (DUF2071 family)